MIEKSISYDKIFKKIEEDWRIIDSRMDMQNVKNQKQRN